MGCQWWLYKAHAIEPFHTTNSLNVYIYLDIQISHDKYMQHPRALQPESTERRWIGEGNVALKTIGGVI